MQIQAALLTEPGQPLSVESLTLDAPKRGEVLVRIAASGVCHSDYHVLSGATKHPLPAVLGHEGAGVVEAVGEGVERVQPGDHIVLNWAPNCGECFYCLRGKPNLCETFTAPIWAGTMLDGTPRLHRGADPVYHYCGLATFGEYVVVPQQSCIPIRRDVPLNIAALVGCAVATGVGAAMYTAEVRPGDRVVVVGCGGVGLNVIQGAAFCGAEMIIAVDSNPAKMAIARQFGATHTLLSGDDTLDAIQQLTGGRGAEHVFDAIGVPAVQEQALAYARPGGTLTLVGLAPMGTNTNFPSALITRQEKQIRGSYYGTVNASRDFPLMLDLYMAGKLKLDELVSREYTLAQVNEAFESMLTGSIARGIIVF
ncbi:MAG: Zn-dependent alcohol dehydrogenase [Chloroflexota bacterium]